MSIDMSQFYQVFFEEAAEHLANMESLLLALDLDNPDPEEINAIFRAAHSIKGSSGTFGFSDMADVTHITETLLDRVRKGEAAMTSEMVDACLVAGDVLKNLLAAHRGEDTADVAAAEAVCERLGALCHAIDNPGAEIGATAPAPVCYEVRFMPDPQVVSDGDEMLAQTLRGMEELGQVEILAQPLGNEPPAPWILHITSGLKIDRIADSIEFVAESGTIRIQQLASVAAAVEEAYGFFEAEAQPAADGEGEAYGFFDPPATVVEQEAYGFFEPVGEPVPAVPAEASGSDEAYGFFEPIGEAAAPVPAPQAVKEEAYGFFEPLPSAAQSADEEAPDGSYGIFATLAEPKATPPSPPARPAEVVKLAQPAELLDAPKAEARSVPAATPKGAAARPAGKAAGGDNSIRVSVDKVDQMINLVGELVITQAMLQESASDVDPIVFERLLRGLAQLERNTRDLQESVMSIRMMPISVVFTRFPRVVRDLSQKLGKKVELKTSGESTELDKSLVERITDPLTHLVRNSLDHGIEMPEKRRAAGKSETGTITLKAYHQSGNIVIEVGDDGAGLNRAKILSKARERGLAAPDSMTDAEVWQLIFEAGFSTADQVTEVSGRGVGMDVVKKNIAAMGGRVDIESMSGIGTRMTVRLPLTLAILDGMSVGVGPETYILPLNTVVESLQPTAQMVRSIAGVERLIQVRGEYLPVVPLHEVFGVAGSTTDWTAGIMVVLESDGQKAALFVDELIGQHQVVIKSLEANYRRVAGVSGATIMGDGRVALILDVAALVSMARRTVPVAA